MPGVSVNEPLDELGLRAHFQESSDAMKAERADAPEEIRGFREWSVRVPEPQVGSLNLRDFPYQVEWYSEEVARAREVVWQKSTQVGMSTNTWRWGAHRADVFGDTVIYVFPTDTHVRDFGDERIEPSIQGSEYLLSRISAHYVRHKSLKRIGAGWLHLRGSRSTGVKGGPGKRAASAQSVAAQALVFDEYDDLDPRNVSQYERRISGAKQIGKAPRVRRLGVPTIAGYGIAGIYERSDQRVWKVACSECGHDQQVQWENVRWTMPDSDKVHRAGDDEYVDPEIVGETWRACLECEAHLDVRLGRWEAQRPGAPVIGYHVSRLIVHTTDLAQIIINSRKTAPHEVEAFWNNDLGLPYSPAESALDDATLQAACSHGLHPEQLTQGYAGPYPTTMGVDVAGERDITVRISEHMPEGYRRALYIGEVGSFQEVVRLIEVYRVHVAVIDSNPERRSAKAVQAMFPGRVILCEYEANDRPDAETIVVKTGKPGTALDGVPLVARCNRTEVIDAMMDGIRGVRNAPLFYPPPRYFSDMKALKRRTVEDSRGRPKRVYVKTADHDDYAHAEVYDEVATHLLQQVQLSHEIAAQAEQPIPDEAIGFKRSQLDVTGDDFDDPMDGGIGGDDYYGGFTDPTF